MNSSDWIILVIVVVLVAAALIYMRKCKKEGKRCVGCPDSGTCEQNCSCRKARSSAEQRRTADISQI